MKPQHAGEQLGYCHHQEHRKKHPIAAERNLHAWIGLTSVKKAISLAEFTDRTVCKHPVLAIAYRCGLNLLSGGSLAAMTPRPLHQAESIQ
jgi:hypothetical protein